MNAYITICLGGKYTEDLTFYLACISNIFSETNNKNMCSNTILVFDLITTFFSFFFSFFSECS